MQSDETTVGVGTGATAAKNKIALAEDETRIDQLETDVAAAIEKRIPAEIVTGQSVERANQGRGIGRVRMIGAIRRMEIEEMRESIVSIGTKKIEMMKKTSGITETTKNTRNTSERNTKIALNAPSMQNPIVDAELKVLAQMLKRSDPGSVGERAVTPMRFVKPGVEGPIMLERAASLENTAGMSNFSTMVATMVTKDAQFYDYGSVRRQLLRLDVMIAEMDDVTIMVLATILILDPARIANLNRMSSLGGEEPTVARTLMAEILYIKTTMPLRTVAISGSMQAGVAASFNIVTPSLAPKGIQRPVKKQSRRMNIAMKRSRRTPRRT